MARLLLVVGIAALASGVAFPNAAGAQALVGGVTVEVDVQCQANNGVQFTMAPWRAELYQGDTIVWVLHKDAQVADITIKPKVAWPFNTNKYNGNRLNPPKSKAMKPNQVKDAVFAYSVTATCVRSGAPSVVIVDPDIIIVGGSQ